MGLGDKISNNAQEVAGKAIGRLGDAPNNEKLQAEGVGDQAAVEGKRAG
ncbi:general stress protein CsbD [Arthrobacter alpinus]|nr:CsbD family protein [Arthrobacter alpinus]ALV44875.1 general stress protein CsbD [Arthrobacter alpinus]